MDCYRKPPSSAKTGEFILTAKSGETFCKVEGLTLSLRMRAVVCEAAERHLSGDERRALVKAALQQA